MGQKRTELVNRLSKIKYGWQKTTADKTNLIPAAIVKSNPAEYKSKFSFAKVFLFTFNKIPRGKAQAPNSVRPIENFSV